MTAPVPVPAAPELLEELRWLCAESVEIPIDKVTAQADLAADLGIDSLTMDELLVMALRRYGMSARVDGIQAMSYPTIGDLAGLIQRLNGDGSDGKNSSPDD